MAAHTSGMDAWVASIRSAMDNDPGIRLLEDQIETHGFLFLDDYLDGILSRPKQDPIVELVKTPGRRRDAPKKTRAAVAAAAKAQLNFTVSHEDDSKENEAPVSSLHEAFLQAADRKGRDTRPSPSPQAGASLAASPTKAHAKQHKSVKIAASPEPPERDEHFIEIMSSSPQPHIVSFPPDSEEPSDPFEPPSRLAPLRADSLNELSIIAEDDEPAERSRISAHDAPSSPVRGHPEGESPSSPGPKVSLTTPDDEDDTTTFREVDMDHNDSTTATAIAVANLTHTSHSHPPPSQTTSFLQSTTFLDHFDQHTVSATKISESGLSLKLEAANDRQPLAPPTSTLFPSKSDITIPLRDSDSSDHSLQRKHSLNQFPSLPAPSPLRKSMRGVQEPSVGLGLPTRTPGVPLGGKRSSWLTKAREAKAMEGVGKRASTIAGGSHSGNAIGVPGLSGGVKRKSSELFASLAPFLTGASSGSDGERKAKVAKTSEESVDIRPLSAKASVETFMEPATTAKGQASAPAQYVTQQSSSHASKLSDEFTTVLNDHSDEEDGGVLGRFKKTVMGARAGKSTGKSLGGTAANELAEARAAAEARVAERHKGEVDETTTAPLPSIPTPPVAAALQQTKPSPLPPPEQNTNSTKGLESRAPVFSMESERRLSLSDLVSKSEADVKAMETNYMNWSPSPPGGLKDVFKPVKKVHGPGADTSSSTTPPNSPPVRPTGFVIPPGPVFSKPPQSESTSDFVFRLPPSSTFPLHAPFNVGLQPSTKLSTSPRAVGLSAQSTQASLFSDAVFESQKEIPAWVPTTQDTDYTQESDFGGKSQPNLNDLDEDDSWPLSDKLAPATNFASIEDSMTWSTIPTTSQRADTGPQTFSLSEFPDAPPPQPEPVHAPNSYDMDVDDLKEQAMAVNSDEDEDEDEGLEEIAAASKSTVSLVESKSDDNFVRSQSVMSQSSDGSSQIGFFGQATKLVSSMLGGGKKGKPDQPKSIQRAAAAAKKQKEEQDRKAARLKEMESRRQAAFQRKAEEEKAKAEEEEKKLKDETERRKKEREEHAGKRPLKFAEKKVDEDNAKKRKLFVEMEKRPEPKKLPAKEKKDPAPSRMTKPSPNPNSSQVNGKSLIKKSSAATLNSTAGASNSTTKPPKASIASVKSKGKANAIVDDDEMEQPSKVIQSQMASRMKAQLQASKPPETPGPPIASELIELPEPNSEYSDSEDENRPRNFDPPDWAQSPELRQALESQRTVNPDDIFGAIRPLRMEDIFRTRQSRFRARTSSANWSGMDGLTEEEEGEYARRMGFR